MAVTRDDWQSGEPYRSRIAGRGATRGAGIGAQYTTANSVGGVAGNPITGEPGWAPGAIFINPLTTVVGNFVWVNTGTVTASVWANIDGVAGTGVARSYVNTAISTAGNGSLTAAAVFGGVITRTGPSAAYTDTAVAAAGIIALLPAGSATDYSWIMRIKNTVPYPATIAAGSNVTVSGLSIIPPLGFGTFLVTYNTSTTITILGLDMAGLNQQPTAQFNTNTTTTTFAAGQLEGADYVVYTNTQGTPGSIATRTAAQMIAGIPNAQVGYSYMLRVINGQGTGTITITAGDVNVTLTGTMTVAANTWRDFVVTITAAGTLTIQNAGVGTFS